MSKNIKIRELDGVADKRNKRRTAINTSSIGIGQTVYVQKSGEAASQMIQAYAGTRYDAAGNPIVHHGRSLAGISEYNVHPDYESSTLRQQAGFSAELIHEARENKGNIMDGAPYRTRTTDGLGRINDPKYDFYEVDADGNILEGTGTQMKFYGVTGDGHYKVIDKLAKDISWDRYATEILIPSDQYEGAVQYADQQARNFYQQAERLRVLGKTAEADKMETLAKRYEQAKTRIAKSDLTAQEALEARVNPERFTASEVFNDSVSAGWHGAKCSMMIAGAITLTQNAVAVIRGDKDLGDAVLDTAGTTARAGAVGFTVGSVGTTVKALMHTSKNELIRHLGTTSAPAMLVTGVLDIAGCLTSFAKGEINSQELFERLGERGTCYIGSGIGASIGGTVGLLAGPAGAVVGGVIGGIASYAVCSALYNSALGVLKDAKIADERRSYLESLCAEASRNMAIYRQILTEYGTRELHKQSEAFVRFFAQIDNSIAAKDIDNFYRSFDALEDTFGLHTQFQSFAEFDDFMRDKSARLVL